MLVRPIAFVVRRNSASLPRVSHLVLSVSFIPQESGEFRGLILLPIVNAGPTLFLALIIAWVTENKRIILLITLLPQVLPYGASEPEILPLSYFRRSPIEENAVWPSCV
jgi:hypothetical protein